MDTLEQGEACKSLPMMLFVRQVGDTVARAGFGFEGEVESEEGHIVERLRQARSGFRKDKVLGFDDWESSLHGASVSDDLGM